MRTFELVLYKRYGVVMILWGHLLHSHQIHTALRDISRLYHHHDLFSSPLKSPLYQSPANSQYPQHTNSRLSHIQILEHFPHWKFLQRSPIKSFLDQKIIHNPRFGILQQYKASILLFRITNPSVSCIFSEVKHRYCRAKGQQIQNRRMYWVSSPPHHVRGYSQAVLEKDVREMVNRGGKASGQGKWE